MKQSTLPAQAGAGFKPAHFAAIDETRQPIGFFEVHAENYMGDGGLPHVHLSRLRRDYALSIHGVGLSIGSMQNLDAAHLERVRRLVERYEPQSFSEHLAWSTHDTVYLNDLLPLPYTEETLARVAEHIDQVQCALKQQMLLENPATYLEFDETSMRETEFLAEIVRRTGCGLLLDVNNVHVASTNHGRDPHAYLADFPFAQVGEIHLAGHTVTQDDSGAPLLIDTHDKPVADPVWALYEKTIGLAGPVATLIEWDGDIPEWPVLRHEALLAQAILDRHQRPAAA
jgi:hypothetical protein